MQSEGNLVDLEKKAAKLIDRGKGPSATDRRLTGIPANWVVRFARAMATPERDRSPWEVVMDCILRGTHNAYNPLLPVCVFIPDRRYHGLGKRPCRRTSSGWSRRWHAWPLSRVSVKPRW
jgi:hypothetical protein